MNIQRQLTIHKIAYLPISVKTAASDKCVMTHEIRSQNIQTVE